MGKPCIVGCSCPCHAQSGGSPHGGKPCPGKAARVAANIAALPPDFDPVAENARHKRIRRLVFERDENCCRFCNKHLTKETRTIDHLVPRSQGGKTTLANCVTACAECNIWKRNRTPEEAGMSYSVR